jgi:hypothetical protein
LNYWIGKYGQLPSTDNPGEAQALDCMMALYGSTEALKAHLTLRGMIQKDVSESDMHIQFGKALIAIRKDLGADTLGIKVRELGQLVLPEANIDTHAVELSLSQHNSQPTSGV